MLLTIKFCMGISIKNHQIQLKWNLKRLQNPFPLKLYKRAQVGQSAKLLPSISTKSLFLVCWYRYHDYHVLIHWLAPLIKVLYCILFCGILAFCQSLALIKRETVDMKNYDFVGPKMYGKCVYWTVASLIRNVSLFCFFVFFLWQTMVLRSRLSNWYWPSPANVVRTHQQQHNSTST